MELLQLQYFERVATFENVSRAAAELHVSQPSLSSAIIRLESELGAKLFDRNGRNIVLNNYGKFFLSNVRKILELISVSKIPFDSQLLDARISIAFQNYNERMFSLIQEFSSLNPYISFNVYGSTLNDPFSVSSYDFIVGSSTNALPLSMSSMDLESRHSYVVLPRKHPFSDRPSIQISDLKHERFCFLKNEQGDFEAAYDFCIEAGFVPTCIFTTNNAFYKMQYLAKGDAVGFIPSGWRDTYTQLANVAALPLKGFEHQAVTRLYWPKNTNLSPAAQNFLSFIRSRSRP